MTRNSLPTESDEPAAEWSTVFMLAALVVALLSLLHPSPFNALSLVAVILLILSTARRVIEYHRRNAAQAERQHHE